MKPQLKGGHGVIPTISRNIKLNGSWRGDVLGRKLKLDLEMLFFGIRGVSITVPLQKVNDLGSLPVCSPPGHIRKNS